MRNSIWCLPSQVLTGSPVCQTRAKFPRSPSLASFSSLYVCAVSECVFVCVCVCVCAHLTLERKNPRKQLLFSLRTHLSLRATASRHPSRPQCGGYLASSSIRGHFRTRRHVRSSASFFSLFPSSARRLVPPPDMSARFFLVFPFANPTISPTMRDIGHRGISLQPALPEFSGDAVESNILVSEHNAPHVISRGVT